MTRPTLRSRKLPVWAGSATSRLDVPLTTRRARIAGVALGVAVAVAAVPVTRALEDAEIKRTEVWRFREG